MNNKKYDIGMVGLGVMGLHLSLNMADHGFSVVGYDRDMQKVKTFRDEAGNRVMAGVKSIDELIARLTLPRKIMLMVPAGEAVDAVITALVPNLSHGDLIIDGGNSFFKDTNKRLDALEQIGILYLGVGISGGETGARFGPSIMPGGSEKAYALVKPIFEAASAKASNEPCVTYLGPGSAGHYVKMVHNGIEYGLMQLIAETYDLMRKGLKLNHEKMHQIFSQWNESNLNSYLIEITSKILAKQDSKSDGFLLDKISDLAKQKGTGQWTSQDAMELHVPLPTIDVAVSMRNLSNFETMRSLERKNPGNQPEMVGNEDAFIEKLENALFTAFLLTFVQAMTLLKVASDTYHYDLNRMAVARIWRGGCIIRSKLLEDIMQVFAAKPDLINMLLDNEFGTQVEERRSDLVEVVQTAAALGVPAPALMNSLAYYDALASTHLPSNLIQAQRDFFGSHTYERIDMPGTFHTKWEEE